MTDTRPGPDELRVRDILRTRGVGPDADEPDLPAEPDQLPDGYQQAPADDPDAWWDRLYAGEQPKPDSLPTPPDSHEDEADDEDEPADETDAEPEPGPAPRKRPRLRKAKPAPPTPTRRPPDHPAVADPRKSLLDAIDGVSHRTRRLISNLAAAGLGWSLGWVDFVEGVCAWVHTHGPTDAQSIFWFCVGVGCLAFARRGRACWWPVAWLASVPAASAIAGVLLYAPTA